MKNDLEMIVKKYGRDQTQLNIYPIGDTQIGSCNFNEKLFESWLEMVKNDPFSAVVMVGDMVNNGLKHSKTNSYAEKLRPREQKEWLRKKLEPISDIIIGAVRGNHEERSVNESDDCPLYDVMNKLDIEDLYRENMAFIKVSLGKRNENRQISYGLVLGHGGSSAKTDKFGYAVDGMDIMVTGHIHQPKSTFPAKIVMDMHNETVGLKGYVHIVVPSFEIASGYVLKGMYLPQDSTKIPIIMLSGENKEVNILWQTLKT